MPCAARKARPSRERTAFGPMPVVTILSASTPSLANQPFSQSVIAAIVERLRADHAHVMPTGGESRRELIREAFGSADARIRALREEELHREGLGGKSRARTRRRFRPDR